MAAANGEDIQDPYISQAEADRSDVQRVLDGDVDSFAGLVNRHQRRLLAFGRRFFRNHHDAEDFVQEVYVRTYQKLDSFRGEGRFFSWLMSIAYNLAVRTAGRRVQLDSIDELSVPSEQETPAEAVERREAAQAVVDAMRALPPRYRVCVDMHFFFGLSYLEISDSTGYPLNTVRSHIRRAKLLLKEQLTESAGGNL
jgi:RNA polymerase sigma-70 factor, ECF subfamily